EKMSEEERSLYEKKLEELDQKYPPVGRANLQDYADHIDHAVRLIGIDHVGIGTDFDGGGGIEGFNDASEALNVTQELLRRGYSEKDIEKIWGGNLLRVWSKVEKVAAQIQKGIG
ncbi:membrane dipeptidase, partial [bacterium]|nr:membrane dipeptidase [bacterium]